METRYPFFWEILSKPEGSEAALSDQTAVNPTFVADVAGNYLVQLIVSDGALDSPPATAVIMTPMDPTAGEPLSCGTLVSGSIDVAGETDLYTFSGQADNLVAITLVDTDGDFTTTNADARALLISPSGAQVGDVFDANSQPQITLPEAGTYTLRIAANNLVSTGSYNVGIVCLQPPAPVQIALSCGDLASSSIDIAGETDLYTFSGQADDLVAITLVDTDGDFTTTDADARALLISPSGAQVGGVFDANSQPQITLPEAGTYTLRIAANNLVSTGSYNVGVVCLQPPAPVQIALSCGDLASSSIDIAGETDLYTFSGQADDLVAITLVDTDGDFTTTNADARALLISPSGAQVGGVFDANSQPQITLPEAGT